MFEWFQNLSNLQKAIIVAVILGVGWFLYKNNFIRESMTGVPMYPSEEIDDMERSFSNEYGVGGGVQASDPTMVMFYARWCPHCQTLKPLWDMFAKGYEGKYGIRFAKVDCEVAKSLAKTHNIDGYPTIKFLPDGLENPASAVVYDGDRSLPSLKQFLDGYIEKYRLNYFNPQYRE
jgi:thiol-disulfide isomerase/thioredoxin